MAIAKCGHAGCSCLPANGISYCSTRCEVTQEDNLPEVVGCSCGHKGCDPRAQKQDVEAQVIADVLEAESRH